MSISESSNEPGTPVEAGNETAEVVSIESIADSSGGPADGSTADPIPSQPIPAAPKPAQVTREPVPYRPAEQGWWEATDGLWYPPERLSGAVAPAAGIVSPAAGSQNVIIQMAHPAAPQFSGPQRSKVVAFLLAFFLGTLGVHRFYLGHSGTGAVMLILSLTFFGLIITVPWALIDCVLILTGGLRDREGRPLA